MILFRTLKLLLPAILPSWNFFDVIAASPRIQFVRLNCHREMLGDWQLFQPKPDHVSFFVMLSRILWNPDWNDSLFMVSCAERIVQNSSDESVCHSENEILTRIVRDECVENNHSDVCALTEYVQFRLVFVSREGDQLVQEVMFHSRAHALISAKDGVNARDD